MASPLVECVPNFSEGRRPEVIEEIKTTISEVDGIFVLDTRVDADHNRCVITFVGSPEAVEEAAFLMIGKAAQLIDLERHSGEHPRIGATDVVPFIPIRDIEENGRMYRDRPSSRPAGRQRIGNPGIFL